jgi:hypothetical protein
MIARVFFWATWGLLVAIAPPVLAQEPAAATKSLTVELNALQPTDKGCRVTFLATNGLGAPLDRAALEVALFGEDGGIDRLVTLDFKALPAGKTKVLQFDLAETRCDGISRVLVNDVAACAGQGVDKAACAASLTTANKTDIAFGL